MIQKLAVNTGGGDAPGLNAALRAIALCAQGRGWDVFGIRQSYRGLVEDDPDGVVRLDRNAVRGIHTLGGTILGSMNRGDPFRYPIEQNGQRIATDVSHRIVENFRIHGFDGLIVIGGDGSMRIAARMLEAGLPRVVGVPKTIDADLQGCEQTLGFDTAVDTVTDALDKLHTTAQAHDRVMVVEVMGRHAGWIALHAGTAGGVDAILIPEIPFDLERVCEKIRQREAMGRHFSIVVVAEGARPREGSLVLQSHADAFGEARLGGIGDQLVPHIARLTGKEVRSLALGHLQRGGSPVMTDRILALRFGATAVRVLAETEASGVVVNRGGRISLVPFEQVTTGTRSVPLDSDLILAARSLGVCLGDESAGTFLQIA
jgi:ATP-dependent phosphofructokinase / diphosphate-dependent phosphofructokinase